MLNIKESNETTFLTTEIIKRAKKCREGQQVVSNAIEILGRDATYYTNVTDALCRVRKLGFIETKNVSNGYGGFDVIHVATSKATSKAA